MSTVVAINFIFMYEENGSCLVPFLFHALKLHEYTCLTAVCWIVITHFALVHSALILYLMVCMKYTFVFFYLWVHFEIFAHLWKKGMVLNIPVHHGKILTSHTLYLFVRYCAAIGANPLHCPVSKYL